MAFGSAHHNVRLTITIHIGNDESFVVILGQWVNRRRLECAIAVAT